MRLQAANLTANQNNDVHNIVKQHLDHSFSVLLSEHTIEIHT